MKSEMTMTFEGWIRGAAMVVALATVAIGSAGCTSGRARNGAAGGAVPGGVAVGGIREAGIMEGDPFVGDGRRDEFAPVHFDYDSAVVSEGERAKVERVASAMRLRPHASLLVEGHCDERGSSEYNLALGERRALALRAYLASMGVEPDRIQTRSFGEETPVRPGHSEEAWRFNRRGEFVVFQR